MANLNGFNANNVEPTTDFEPIPAGKYLAVITASEMKATRAGDGHFLELQFQILDGPYKGRLLWSRFNLDNPNAQAVQIAQAELSAVCRATGIMQPRDSVELHGIPLVIGVRLKRRTDSDELVNEVRGYSRRDSLNGMPQQATSNTPPWARR
ncbi:MAG: DUF669 domain-containing protein [Candidatus Eisenbacteria bacterium]|nr:DUF669 domain-containing protein [Candidatus Eisenbacteria bacterium]